MQLTNQDGEQIEVVARAIDQAGNVGPESEPVTVILDSVGPAITVTQTSPVLQGMVSDGSGVASVEVSLNGGADFLPAALSAGAWTFAPASAPGPRQEFAIVRARDVWDNLTHEMVVGVVLQFHEVYVPMVLRHR
jgi:hypothetical protein